MPEDLADGVRLLQFLELVTERTVPGGYKKEPTNRIQKIENCSKAIKFIKEDLQIRLVGIGAEGMYPTSFPHLPKPESPVSNESSSATDLADGNLMLVLGLLWSSFRKLSLGRIGDSLTTEGQGEKTAGKARKPEDDLLKWLGEITQDYDVPVVSFKERYVLALCSLCGVHCDELMPCGYRVYLLISFNDGMVFAALVDRFDPEFLNFAAVSEVLFNTALMHDLRVQLIELVINR